MKGRSFVISATLALAALALALGQFKLRPGVVDNRSIARWEVVKEAGFPANHVLVLHKTAPLTEWTAAYAVIDGVGGLPVNAIDRLSYDNLTPGTEGGGSPRWNLEYGAPGQGTEGYMFLDLTNNDLNHDGMIDESEIAANPNWVGRPFTATDEITWLYLIVDEQERVVLDDIEVIVNGVPAAFQGPGISN